MRAWVFVLSLAVCHHAVAGERSGAVPITIGGGAFFMGSDDGAADESPVHEVSLAPFAIDRYEVTNARYGACVAAGVCTPPALPTSRGRPRYFREARFASYPVVFVSFEQASRFCAFAGGRLPTEAEWEKAARGPAPELRIYPWGDDAPTCERANMESCVGDTDAVGVRPLGRSPYGLFDMAGNVWEWVADWYDPDYYEGSPLVDPHGPDDGMLRVMRGGCWESGASSLRVSCRKAELPKAWADNVGFRCAYDVRGEP